MNKFEKCLVTIVRKSDSLFNCISILAAVLTGAILVAVTLIIFMAVINRSFIGWIWLFVEEYSGLALIPMSFLAFGYAHRKGRHLKMDLIVKNLPLLGRNIFALISGVFALVVIGFMVDGACSWLAYTYEKHATSGGPMGTQVWPISLMMVIGLVLFFIDMLMFVLDRIIIMRHGISVLKVNSDIKEIDDRRQAELMKLKEEKKNRKNGACVPGKEGGRV